MIFEMTVSLHRMNNGSLANKSMARALRSMTVVMALASSAPSAFAINGIYLSGYGFESAMMGGADVAVSRDAFAANNNPAGMTQLRRAAAEFDFVTNYDLDMTHDDAFNSHKPRADRSKAYVEGAYSRPLDGTPYAAGVALVVQGGFGWTYRGMNTRFGTRDDAAGLFGVVKLAPALAWKVNDQLSVGAALGVNYFAGSQELFPNTTSGPVPGLPFGFNGFRFRDASGIGFNGKLGLQYRPTGNITVGFTYGTGTSIPIKDGNMRLNLSNFGLGVVRYDNAELQGFRLPDEFSLGLAIRPRDSLLVSMQAKHYYWSDALKTLTLVARSPRNALAPPTVALASPANFHDQDVLQLGVVYNWTELTTLYGGFNYGSKAVPDRNVTPIFAPITQRHVSVGFSHVIDAGWRGAVGFEWFMPQTATYSSPIFGTGASERADNLLIHFSLSRLW